jgi:hypothetical protein
MTQGAARHTRTIVDGPPTPFFWGQRAIDRNRFGGEL